MRNRITLLASGVFAALAAFALTAGSAAAAVGPNIVTIGSGEAGYYAVSGSSFRNVGFTEQPLAAATNIGGVGRGGIGGQLCDPNNGEAIQAGLVANRDLKTFTVEYATGILSGANVDNCVGNPLLTGPVALHATTLSGVAVSDHVQVLISFQNHKVTVRHPGHWTSCFRGKGAKRHLVVHCRWHRHFFTRVWKGEGKVQAFDTDSGTEVYSTGWLAMGPDWNMDHAGVGIQQDTTGMSAGAITAPPGYDGTHGPTGTGAVNPVVTFSNVFANGTGLGGIGAPLSSPFFSAFQVATAAGANKANPAIVAPNDSGLPGIGSFTVSAGNPTV